MKKLVGMVLVATMLLLCVCGTASADWVMVHVTAKCADLNHVGSDWNAIYTIGGVEVRDNDIIDLYEGSYDFSAQIYDSDSVPDTGETVKSFKVSASNLESKRFTKNLEVIVTEDRGVYKNNWCEWYVEFELVPVNGWEYILH